MVTTQKPNAEGLLGVRGATMSDKPENPPAFPAAYAGHLAGMTLRDWLAGQALPSYLDGSRTVETAVSMAYYTANAMLEERGKWA